MGRARFAGCLRSLPVCVGALAVLAAAVEPSAAAVPSVGCSDRVEGSRPPNGDAHPGDLRIGPLRFARLELRAPRLRGQGLWHLKAGVAVRHGQTVVLSIAPEDRAFASLTYAGIRRQVPLRDVEVADGYPVVRFRACAQDEPAFSYSGPVGVETGFGGGFIVDGPRCVTLVVRERGSTNVLRRQVPFGVADCG